MTVPNLDSAGRVNWGHDVNASIEELQTELDAVDASTGPTRNALDMGIQPSYSNKLPFSKSYR